MKYYYYIFLFIFFNGINVFSQEKFTRHTVLKGETLSEIAQEYDVKLSEIYELNPDARNGIRFKSILLIPTKAKKSTVVLTAKIANKSPELTHEVLAKETLYGIAKQHNITIDDLYKINPDLEKQGLKKGQIIKIPQTAFEKLDIVKEPENSNVSKKNVPKTEIVVAPKSDEKMDVPIQGIEYEVLPRESFYSIAKKYGITLADLQKANSTLETKSLKAGQKIIVPIKANANSSLVVEKAEEKEIITEKVVAVVPHEIVDSNKLEKEIKREVLPKETKYGIAKEYGITVAELEKQNPEIIKKLLVGSVLKIRSPRIIEKVVPVEVVINEKPIVNINSNNNIVMVHDAAFVDQLILTASENIGTRYRSGGTTKEGFDCSGLMYSTFNTYDIKLPRSSFEMSSYGFKINTENAQKGDLIFFKTNGRRQINHVGMVVEVLDGEIKFIHSSNHGGVIISSTKESYYEKNLVQVNRVF